MTEFTILMPCLNEEKTIGSCIDEAKKGIAIFPPRYLWRITAAATVPLSLPVSMVQGW